MGLLTLSYMASQILTNIIQVMASRRLYTKPLHEPMMIYCQSNLRNIPVKIEWKYFNNYSSKCSSKCRLENVSHFILITVIETELMVSFDEIVVFLFVILTNIGVARQWRNRNADDNDYPSCIKMTLPCWMKKRIKVQQCVLTKWFVW